MLSIQTLSCRNPLYRYSTTTSIILFKQRSKHLFIVQHIWQITMASSRLGASMRQLGAQFSRTMTTSTPNNNINVLSGIPEKHASRRVRIYRPTKVATQQGRGSITQMWRMQFEKMEDADRWTNPLMGWTSTGDPLSTMGLPFPTKDAAIEYAQRYNYEFTVVEPEKEKQAVRPIKPFKRAMVHHWRHEAPKYD